MRLQTRSSPRRPASPAGVESPLEDLLRLALPAALGEQGPLIENGLDSIRISSSGERPPAPADDQPSEIAPGTIDRFGRATLALMLALDAAPSPLEHGPGAYVGLAGNLLPGWAIALVALSLLAPVGLAAAQGVGSSPGAPGRPFARSYGRWGRAAPFLAALLALYLLDWVGVVPDPPFPFDRAQETLGLAGRIGVAIALAILGTGLFFVRALRPPPAEASASAAPAVLSLASAAVLLIWLLNPYLALLLVIGLNVWLLAALASIPGRLAAAALIAVGLIPLALGVIDLAGRLGKGLDVLTTILLMITDGQIGFALAMLGCVLAGCAVSIVALAGPVPSPPAPEIHILARLRRRREPIDHEQGETPQAGIDGEDGEPEPEPDSSVYW